MFQQLKSNIEFSKIKISLHYQKVFLVFVKCFVPVFMLKCKIFLHFFTLCFSYKFIRYLYLSKFQSKKSVRFLAKKSNLSLVKTSIYVK